MIKWFRHKLKRCGMWCPYCMRSASNDVIVRDVVRKEWRRETNNEA